MRVSSVPSAGNLRFGILTAKLHRRIIFVNVWLTEAEAPCETSASDNGGNVWESNPPSV